MRMLRSSINALASAFGLKVVRVPRCQSDTSSPNNGSQARSELRIGAYTLRAPDALSRAYADYPEMNRTLGRLARLLAVSEPGIGVIDVGANCGDTAAVIRSQCELPILCIEGDDQQFALLSEHAKQIPGLTLLQAYLSEVGGDMEDAVEKRGWNNTLIPGAPGSEKIRLHRLDAIEHPWLAQHRVGLLKCDTEGFDIRILHGARGILKRDQPVVHFEYNRENMDRIGEPGLRIFPFLAGLDYSAVLVYDNIGRMLMATEVSSPVLADLHEYSYGPRGLIYYYDFFVFPKLQTQVCRSFYEQERQIRRKTAQV